MPTIISRSVWGAAPPESSTPWNPDNLLGVVVHHFAIPRSASSPAGSAALVRSVQRAHQAGEFSDIAYNHVFDKFGQIFEGRGFGIMTGAHTPLNSTHAAICYMGDSDLDGFPEAAQKAAAWLLKEWFKRGAGVSVKAHGDIAANPTGCPGRAAGGWVRSGAWKADLPGEERRLVQYLLMDEGEVLDRSRRVPVAESLDRLKKFMASDAVLTAHARMKAESSADGKLGRVGIARKVTIV